MVKLENIKTLSFFKKYLKTFISDLEIGKGPYVITQHGEPVMVALGINTYQQIEELAEIARHSIEQNEGVSKVDSRTVRDSGYYVSFPK